MKVEARGRVESGDTVEHQADHVPTAALEVFGVFQGHTDGWCDGASVNQVEPAQRDDAEQQLRGLARG